LIKLKLKIYFDKEGTLTQITTLLTDITIQFALGSIMLLIIAELIAPQSGPNNMYINKRNLRRAALIVTILFFTLIIIKAIAPMILP
jgi:hypothetical protein